MACISMPTAMLISGGLSAAGGLANSFIGANAATQAAKLQSDAAKEAQQQTLAMYKMNKDLLSPFIQGGYEGMSGVINLLGGGSMDSNTIQSFLSNTPGYQFALKQGLQATQSGYAAKGLASSGAALKGAADYAEGLAGTQYQNIFQNFLDTAKLGEGAGSAVAGMGAQSQQSINDLITGGATAEASGKIGAANAFMSGIGNAADAFGNSATMLGLYNAGFFGNKLMPAATSGSSSLWPWTGARA